MKTIKNYINGKFIGRDKTVINEKLAVTNASFWDITFAIRSITIIQKEIASLDIKSIIKVLENSIKYFNPSYSYISSITLSDVSFIKEAMQQTKNWCGSISRFYNKIINKEIIYNSSSPVVCVLPSNSEQEALFIIFQILLSKNAGIIRPSQRGAGAYTCIEIIKAINKAVDKLKDKKLQVLKKAISLVNIPSSQNYLSMLSVTNWNYIFFGSEKNIVKMKNTLTATPRKVISYGSGLAMTIIWNDIDLKKYINEIIYSIVVNGGNECECTHILYIHKEKYNEFINYFEKLAKCKTIINKTNIDYIISEFSKRNLQKYLKFKNDTIMPSCMPLTEFESAFDYPGPILSIRKIENNLDLLIAKDLKDNNIKKNIITSIFTKKKFDHLSIFAKSHIVKHNLPTYPIDLMMPHQCIYLPLELMNFTYLQKRDHE